MAAEESELAYTVDEEGSGLLYRNLWCDGLTKCLSKKSIVVGCVFMVLRVIWADIQRQSLHL